VAFLIIYKASSLVAKGLLTGVAIRGPSIHRPIIWWDYSRASCTACCGVGCRQYRWCSGITAGLAARLIAESVVGSTGSVVGIADCVGALRAVLAVLVV